MIDALLRFLEDEEGFRAWVYDDANGEPIVPGYTVKGHPTIWYGLCLEKGRIPGLPKKMPRDSLSYVAESKALALLEQLPWLLELPEKTQVGLGAMAYQLGVDGVMKFKNMISALAVGDLNGAAAHALDSDWARKDTPARAKRVAALIANGGRVE